MNAHGRAVAVWHAIVDRATTRSSRFRFAHGWSRPQALGSSEFAAETFLTRSGTAVVTLGFPGSRITRWAYQLPGGRWYNRPLRGVSDIADMQGSGQRIALLYNNPRLRARHLQVPVR